MSYNKIYLKLTTVPFSDDLEIDSLEFELFKEKYSEAKEYINDRDVLKSYEYDAAKNPSFGKIYSATIGCVLNDTIITKVMKGSEKDILLSIIRTLNSDDFKSSILVGYNFAFLYPFITTRMNRNGININELPKQLHHYGKKTWNLKQSKDVQEYMKGVGYYISNARQAFWDAGLKTDVINGRDIYLYIKNGKIDEIDQSDTIYMESLINLDRVSEGESILVNTNSRVELLNDVKVVKLPIVDIIQQSGNITREQADKIIEQNKDETLENKNIVIDNIKAMLIYNNDNVEQLENYKYLCENLIAINTSDFVFDGEKFQKKDANVLIKKYEDESEDVKKNVLVGVRKHILENNHQAQTRVKSAYKYLQEEFGVQIKL